MATLRLVFDDQQIGSRMKRRAERFRSRVLGSMRSSALQLAENIESEGRRDIASAGNFSARWTQAFKATVTEGGGFFRVTVTMGGDPPVAYWRVFEEGRVIRGKPMLWIPLSFATDAQRTRARDYPGPLFRVDRAGKAPLLLTTGGVPKYFGKEQVTIPKKFHLTEIVRKWSRRAGDVYRRTFRRSRRG